MGVILYWRVKTTAANLSKIEAHMTDIELAVRSQLSKQTLDFTDLHNGCIGIVYKNSDTVVDRRRRCRDIVVKGLRFQKPNLKHPKKYVDYLVTPL